MIIKKAGRRFIAINGYEIDCTEAVNSGANIDFLDYAVNRAFECGQRYARDIAVEAFKDLIQSKFLTENDYENKNS